MDASYDTVAAIALFNESCRVIVFVLIVAAFIASLNVTLMLAERADLSRAIGGKSRHDAGRICIHAEAYLIVAVGPRKNSVLNPLNLPQRVGDGTTGEIDACDVPPHGHGHHHLQTFCVCVLLYGEAEHIGIA